MWYKFAKHHLKKKVKRFLDESPSNTMLDDDLSGIPDDFFDNISDNSVDIETPKRGFKPWNWDKPEEVGGQDVPLPGVINAPGEPKNDKPILPRVQPLPEKPDIHTIGVSNNIPEQPKESDISTEEPPQNPTGVVPPIHESCHCNLKTLPGGRQIWEASHTACDDCKSLRDQFNSTQDMLFPVSKKTEIQTQPMRMILKSKI